MAMITPSSWWPYTQEVSGLAMLWVSASSHPTHPMEKYSLILFGGRTLQFGLQAPEETLDILRLG